MAQRQGLPPWSQDRLTSISTLLFLIDPVRGKPTRHILDRHIEDGAWQHENLQKKFLVSFALICSTSRKGGETASAVCMEQHEESGTTLRLARNHGVTHTELNGLQDILNDLSAPPQIGRNVTEREDKILYKIIVLDESKIRDIIERIHRGSVQQEIIQAVSKLKRERILQDNGIAFQEWIGKLASFLALPVDASIRDLMPHIKWASQARWIYSKQLELLSPSAQGGMPKWAENIAKLGRYYAATLAMIKYALKKRQVFSSICIKPIDRPAQENFNQKDKSALSKLVKSLTNEKSTEVLEQLGRDWNTSDPEAHFRSKCRHKLTLHAEMQLLSFYDRNRHLVPQFLFMGTSKKACFLCHKFLSLHTLKMEVFACHQKIYPSWMPPSGSGPLVQKNRVLIDKLNGELAKVATHELRTELGRRRRTVNQDSTAGPSLTLISDDLLSAL